MSFDESYENVPNKGESHEENGRMVHWNFAGVPFPHCLSVDYAYDNIAPLEQRVILVEGEKQLILKWESPT